MGQRRLAKKDVGVFYSWMMDIMATISRLEVDQRLPREFSGLLADAEVMRVALDGIIGAGYLLEKGTGVV